MDHNAVLNGAVYFLPRGTESRRHVLQTHQTIRADYSSRLSLLEADMFFECLQSQVLHLYSGLDAAGCP